jgi:8-amino-7-oxononanoate synthase
LAHLRYTQELEAIKKANRFRQRVVFEDELKDFASNDYLGLASKIAHIDKATKVLKSYSSIAPKASMLVNGYHQIHKDFEDKLALLNGFESAICVGSGFLANMALIESLVRKNDMLFMDEEYHASGVMASRLLGDRVIIFKHNDIEDLKLKFAQFSKKRNIIAIEGVYSMLGDLVSKEIIDFADESESILIVDEAHSAGVIGDRLLGIFDYFNIKVKPTHIKMGTLGKAYGSYGAYILATKEIISFLENRAKPIIYSTAPSLFDVVLAHVNIDFIASNLDYFNDKLKMIRELINEQLKIELKSSILAIEMKSSTDTLNMQKKFISKGYLVGAIRPPTVKTPILRIIPRVSLDNDDLRELLRLISHNQ